MKFLIFNVIVFCSLGYLLTSSPNENFSKWFVDKKNKIVNFSKEDYVNKMKNAVSKNNNDEVTNNLHSITSKENKKEHAQKIQNAIKSAKNNKDLKIKNVELENELLKVKEELKKIKTKKEQDNFARLEEDKKTSQQINPSKENDTKRKIEELANKFKENKVFKSEKSENFEKNKFLSPEERGQALAELITDLQMYSLKGIIN